MDEDPTSFHSLAEQLSAQGQRLGRPPVLPGGYLGTVVKSKLRSMAKRAARSEASSSTEAQRAGGRLLSL